LLVSLTRRLTRTLALSMMMMLRVTRAMRHEL
jgi:hypothetical protein